jgi:transposase-like protein
VHTHRYEKQVPGHHVQVDVKFLTLKRNKGASVRRYQYTAIDDATRVRALKIYRRHTQANAIDFINYVVDKFPFRIRTIRTDRGHEFQALCGNASTTLTHLTVHTAAKRRMKLYGRNYPSEKRPA